MSDFDGYKYECRMEDALEEVYHEWWYRMLQAFNSLDEQEADKLSNPFVIKCLPAYRNAKRKVLIVGKETNGWGSFHSTLNEYKHSDRNIHRDRVIDYLQWMYEDFRWQRKWDHTPFWRGSRELFQAIAPLDGDDAFYIHSSFHLIIRVLVRHHILRKRYIVNSTYCQ